MIALGVNISWELPVDTFQKNRFPCASSSKCCPTINRKMEVDWGNLVLRSSSLPAASIYWTINTSLATSLWLLCSSMAAKKLTLKKIFKLFHVNFNTIVKHFLSLTLAIKERTQVWQRDKRVHINIYRCTSRGPWVISAGTLTRLPAATWSFCSQTRPSAPQSNKSLKKSRIVSTSQLL